MTARFNGYFNGKESYREAMDVLASKHEEDYYDVLPVYLYGNQEAASSVMGQTDRCIEKGSYVIERHSMFFKRKEYCNWVDDSYMLIGKARFLRKDLDDAKTAFEYVAREFDYNEIRFEAKLWLAKTYVEQKKQDKALTFLDVLSDDKELPKKLKGDLYATYTDLFIRSSQYDLALENAKLALEHARKRDMKIRLRYILAQLYHETGESQLASDGFGKVIKMNPPYEMAFYAKINRALSADEFSGNSAEIKRELLKMTKDEKNEDYFDQIYYALAEMEFKQGDEDKGIEYLKNSALFSVDNDAQKGKSLLRLAEIYYGRKDYPNAEAYYDSTVTYLPKENKKYKEAVKRKGFLNDLVVELNIIAHEDSLQRVAKMSEKDQKKLVDKIIKDVIAEEQRKQKEEETEGRQDLSERGTGRRANPNRGAGSNWYFYNPQSISFGFAQFKKTWGDRKLADNWRRSNLGTSLSDFDQPEEGEEKPEEGEESKDAVVAAEQLRNPEYYLSQLPNDAAELAASNNRIEVAMFSAGMILKDRIMDYRQAIVMLESLVERNKQAESVVAAYYQLYRINLEIGDEQRAQYYRYIITNQYPDSEYAKVILDPNYRKGEDQKHSKEERDYTRTYNTFAFSQFSQTIMQCDKAIEAGDNHLLPKYYLLRAISYGHQNEMPMFRTKLNEIITLYPGGEEAIEAQRLLDLINERKLGQEEPTAEDLFVNGDKEEHLFTFIFPKDTDKNDIKNTIANFNAKYFKTSKLKVQDTFLSEAERMVSVSYFEDKEKAMQYYSTFVSNDNMLKDLNEAGYSRFVISSPNYKSLFNTKDLESYLGFFEENYLQ